MGPTFSTSQSPYVPDIFNDPTFCALSSVMSQPLDARSCNSKFMVAHPSNETVHHITKTRPSRSPADSFGSKSSGVRHVASENIAPGPSTSHIALQETVPESFSSLEQTPEEARNRTFCKMEQWSDLAHGDHIEGGDLTMRDDRARPSAAPRPVHLSVTNLEEDADISHSEMKAKYQELADPSDEEALAEKQSFRDGSQSRKDSPRIVVTGTAPQAFKRMINSIRSGQLGGPRHLKFSEERQDLGDEFELEEPSDESLELPPQRDCEGHRKMSSGFSSGLMGTIKSATNDLSSSSVLNGSQKTHWSKSRLSRFSKRSSRVSDAANRSSLDSDRGPSPATYKATTNRALQRRRIIGELVASETGYIYDLKILTHVYLALLGSTQNFGRDRLAKVEDNIAAMIALHEEILLGMKAITQGSIIPTEAKRTLPKIGRHIRYESIDSLRSISRGRKTLKARGVGGPAKDSGLTAEPKEAAEVASLFRKMLGGTASTQMGKFSVYEEYGAKYAEILQACVLASRTIPNWEIFERGIEALVNQVLRQGMVPKGDRKALTFEDLLIKPIQRICRYPLIFADLESHCPAIDDPESHMIIRKVLDRLREMAHETNDATNDLEAQARLRRSQHLEDLLAFPATHRPSFSVLRDLGHAKLCGVLFVAYQSRGGGFRGDFMLCALFNSFLLLASPELGYKRFTICAIISLADIRLDLADSGKGLQCYTTPYAWKMLFLSEGQFYEILLCACTELEEERWRSELRDFSAQESQRQIETDYHLISKPDFLSLEIQGLAEECNLTGAFSCGRFEQPMSKITGQTRSVPVIVKNAHTPVKGDHLESQNNVTSSSNRLTSRPTMEALHTFVADRSDRIRMEQAMSDVWTRGTLPFPAMTTGRSSHFFRASTSVMRRLSKASVTSTPSRRSASQRSRASTIEIYPDGAMDDPFLDRPKIASLEAAESTDKGTALLVFHYPPVNNKGPRKVLFSPDLKVRERTAAEMDSSEASIVTERIGGHHVENTPKISKSLTKALSKERIRGWFS